MDQEEAKYRVVLEDEGYFEDEVDEELCEEDVSLTVKINSNVVQVGRNAKVIFKTNKTEHERREADSRKQNIEDESTTSSEIENSIPKKTKKKPRKSEKTHGYSKSLVPYSPKNLQPSQPSKSYLNLYQISDDVMIQVRTLRDNGRWDLFEDTAVQLSRKYTAFEAQIVLSLERGIAACYNNRLKEAKEKIKSAIHMASGLENSSVLVGRGLYYLSAVYRRDNKIGKAVSCTELAEQNFFSTNVIDRCALTYERASALMDFVLQCQEPRTSVKKQVIEILKRCIDECMVLIEDERIGCCIQSHRYAFIKIAMLLLDCRTSAGRRRSVNQEKIQEAEKYLAALKDKHWDETSRGEKVQYYLGQADLHYRKQLYPEAREYAEKALKIAESFGFNTEIKLVKDRLDDINSAFDRYQHCAESRDDYDDNQSSSHVADVSDQSTDSDWLLQPSFI